jgi:hypothetical protein
MTSRLHSRIRVQNPPDAAWPQMVLASVSLAGCGPWSDRRNREP